MDSEDIPLENAIPKMSPIGMPKSTWSIAMPMAMPIGRPIAMPFQLNHLLRRMSSSSARRSAPIVLEIRNYGEQVVGGILVT